MGGPGIHMLWVEEIVQTCHLHGIHKIGGPILHKPTYKLQ